MPRYILLPFHDPPPLNYLFLFPRPLPHDQRLLPYEQRTSPSPLPSSTRLLDYLTIPDCCLNRLLASCLCGGGPGCSRLSLARSESGFLFEWGRRLRAEGDEALEFAVRSALGEAGLPGAAASSSRRWESSLRQLRGDGPRWAQLCDWVWRKLGGEGARAVNLLRFLPASGPAQSDGGARLSQQMLQRIAGGP